MLPLSNWCTNLEESALKQAENACNHPALIHHVALMPDAHHGYGVPIGSVLAAEDAVLPNAVGVDIGCGVLSTRFLLKKEEMTQDLLKQIMARIRETIPLGMNHRKTPCLKESMPVFSINNPLPICEQQFEKARFQLGTLGGGNHFIEIQHDTNHIWVMIHSGSRNLGFTVAKHYNDLAKELNTQWKYHDLVKQDLAFFPYGTLEYEMYMTEMSYCVLFAIQNRYEMIKYIHAIFMDVFDKQIDIFKTDVAHNYVRMENHFDKNLMIHRKGAIHAATGHVGLVPGSQGTNSYMTRGLGNVMSFKSSSHGAGRKMSRKKAKKELNIKDESELMNKRGILHAIRHKDDLDEAPGAYKDIEEVMDNQKELTESFITFTPMGVIKA